MKKILNKEVKQIMYISALFCGMFSSQVYALDLNLDFNYTFKTEQSSEFYINGITNVNYNGEVADYIRNLYDFTPQTVYNSDYGATVIAPQMTETIHQNTYAPSNAPSGNYSSVGAYNGGDLTGITSSIPSNSESSGGSITGSLIDTTPPTTSDFTGYEEYTPYPLTEIAEVRQPDGQIGTLKIPRVGLTVEAYDGDTYTAMAKGIGHISSTSSWVGNIGLVGHNRGSTGYFEDLKSLVIGDEIIYETILGQMTYVVVSIDKISETDWSKLEYTYDNRLTLITCVEDVANQRLCVQAIEKIS